MKIATWNVNGIRARAPQLREWLLAERPDVLCLQEIKATPEQVPRDLCEMGDHWCYWHGARAYSGVALLVRRDFQPQRPDPLHPPFDQDCRIVCVEIGDMEVASVYVPNGNRDLPGKVRFLQGMVAWAAERRRAGRPLVVCGDLNVARTDADVHPKERKAGVIGQLPEERALFEALLAEGGLTDVARALHPDDDQLFTWWAPWRNLRQRNIGWRIDYVLASAELAGRARTLVSQRVGGTSDHAPVVLVLSQGNSAQEGTDVG
jgi:exodeoxyribonuclease-3